MKNIFLYELLETMGYQLIFCTFESWMVVLPWGDMDVAVGGLALPSKQCFIVAQDVPLDQHEQKQSTAFVCSARFGIPYEK
ncbi:hypothetical protein [Acinetobacter sp. WZC-1]|uniref:hypothetical protein n=1 Tax=Acinetobacter sp. WZC-1 TaxID=3459034 RepID=UPI00403DC78F